MSALRSSRGRISVRLLEVGFSHPVRLIVNALGSPPADVVERCHDAGVLVGALVGTPAQAVRQKEPALFNR